MKIVIDAMGIQYASGGRTATMNLLLPILEIDRQNEYCIALTHPEPELERFKSNKVNLFYVPTKNRFLTRSYANLVFPWKFRHFNLIHFAKNLGLFGPLPRSILTIYDMSMLLYPQIMPKTDLWYWKTLQKISINKAWRIVTISQSAAKDIQKLYHISPAKIEVIYPAQSPVYKPVSQKTIREVQEKYNLPGSYLLHVGRIDPIKNLPLLVRSFHKLKQSGAFNGKLVLVGEMFRKYPDADLLPTIERLGLQNDVILTGFIPDQELAAVYCGAKLKIFPSLNEGFGLVALEAMACGTPVIASRAGSIPEVVGDAAILLDKLDEDCISQTIAQALENPTLLDAYREKGYARSQEFNWYNTARQTLALYQRSLEEN